ncbi:BNR-4 repeat-containing protein [Mucisphaera calidilacus]|uniref:BNR-4 repeat-containing protein n=1 Tax=Mucisphaera calidilacus TaxID=2527982 RepID=UPI001F2EA5DD|nr:BNR-4 repeat-containing protein [Mucisphaera calidilacus]
MCALIVFVVLLASACSRGVRPDAGLDPGLAFERGRVVDLAPNGSWVWHTDPVTIWSGGRLYYAYVDSTTRQIMVNSYGPGDGSLSPINLSTERSVAVDDHDHPSISILPDGRLLLVYCRHGRDRGFYFRHASGPTPRALDDLSDERFHGFEANTCYTNVYYLRDERRLHYFGRGVHSKPTWLTSTDLGQTWSDATPWIIPEHNAVRPYVHYASNGRDRIDMIYTDGHPRDEKNSIYHAYYQDDAFYRADGRLIVAADDLPMVHEHGQKGGYVYRYSERPWDTSRGPDDWIPFGRAWVWDIEHDESGNPVCVFTVQVDAPEGSPWTDGRIYYYYGWWDGAVWNKRLIAKAGNALYRGEDDFAGGIALDPDDPSRLFLSSNAVAPFDLTSLDTRIKGDDAYSLYRVRFDRATGRVESEPFYSAEGEMIIRPFVPAGDGPVKSVVWMQGPNYPNMRTYPTRIAGWFSGTEQND